MSHSGVLDNKVWEALREASLDIFARSLPNVIDAEIGESEV